MIKKLLFWIFIAYALWTVAAAPAAWAGAFKNAGGKLEFTAEGWATFFTLLLT